MAPPSVSGQGFESCNGLSSPPRSPFAPKSLAPDGPTQTAAPKSVLDDGQVFSRTSVTNETPAAVPTAQTRDSQTTMDSSSSDLSWGNLLGDSPTAPSPRKYIAQTKAAALQSAEKTVLAGAGYSAVEDALPSARPLIQEFGGGHSPKNRNLGLQSSAQQPSATNAILPVSGASTAAPRKPTNLRASPPSTTPASVQHDTPTHAETSQHTADRTSSWVYGVTTIDDVRGQRITPQQAPNGVSWLLKQRSEAGLRRDFDEKIKRRDALYHHSNSRFSSQSATHSAQPLTTQLTAPQLPPHRERGRDRILDYSIPRSLESRNQIYTLSGHGRNLLPSPTNAPAVASMRQTVAPSMITAPYDTARPVNLLLAHPTTQEAFKPPGPSSLPNYLRHSYAPVASLSPMAQPPRTSVISSVTNSAPQMASMDHTGIPHGYTASGPTSYRTQFPSHSVGYPHDSMANTGALHPSNFQSYPQGPQAGHMLPLVQYQIPHSPIDDTPYGYVQEDPGQPNYHPKEPVVPQQGATYMGGPGQPSYLLQAPPSTCQGAYMVGPNQWRYTFGPAPQIHVTGSAGSAPMQIGGSSQLFHHSRRELDPGGSLQESTNQTGQNTVFQAPSPAAPTKYTGNPRTSMNQGRPQGLDPPQLQVPVNVAPYTRVLNQSQFASRPPAPQEFSDDYARGSFQRTREQADSRWSHASPQRPRLVNTDAAEVRPEFTLRPDLGRSLPEYARLRKLQGDTPLSSPLNLPKSGNFSFPRVPAIASTPPLPPPSHASSSSPSRLDEPDDLDGDELIESPAVPPELPPSVEEAYRKKCIQLKTRLNEVEEANDASRLRIERLNRAIEKGRLERAFLLEQLAKRTSTNVEDSEGSPSPPPTPKEKPLRTKRGHRKPDFLSTDIGDGRAGSTFIQQGPVTLSPSSDAFSHTHPEMRNSTPQAHQAPKRHLPSNGTHASPYAAPGASRVKPRSGFDIYCEENRELLIAEQGEDQIESALARGWSTMEPDRKAEYSAKVEDQRRAYEAERAARHNPVDEDVEMGEDAATPGPATGLAATPATGGFNPINSSRVE